MRWKTLAASAVLVAMSTAASPCSDHKLEDDETDTDVALCTCDQATLHAGNGCENFGGDEELCSGWRSCEQENGYALDSTWPTGTELVCFGCTIELVCD